MTKLQKLVSIALKTGTPIAPSITVDNLVRLVNGDLTLIGDAIVEGEVVILEGEQAVNLLFTMNACSYTIVENEDEG